MPSLSLLCQPGRRIVTALGACRETFRIPPPAFLAPSPVMRAFPMTSYTRAGVEMRSSVTVWAWAFSSAASSVTIAARSRTADLDVEARQRGEMRCLAESSADGHGNPASRGRQQVARRAAPKVPQ